MVMRRRYRRKRTLRLRRRRFFRRRRINTSNTNIINSKVINSSGLFAYAAGNGGCSIMWGSNGSTSNNGYVRLSDIPEFLT